MNEDTYKFDIHKKVIVNDCNLYPTETSQKDTDWLFAENNKYSLFDRSKRGRWVVPVAKENVNAAWDKIKTAVTNGELWKAEVSTSDPAEPNESHIIMIDTKDYTDLDDVIFVLDYLEKSEIKSRSATIKYKIHQQFRTDIYRGGGEKAWMYSSDTVRPMLLIQPMGNSSQGVYEFDIHEMRTVTDCSIRPTEVSKCDFVWLEAQNNKYTDNSVDDEKIGKWVFFLSKHSVNETWSKIKMAVAKGELWSSCVSTTDPVRSEETHAVMIYTKDYTDLDDIIQVLDYLESCGIKPPNVISTYKINQKRYANIYNGGRERSWIYSSFTVRSKSSTQQPDNSVHDTYRFDVYKKKLVTECNSYPSETSMRDFELLKAVNNQHDESIDSDKRGRWMLDIPSYSVDEFWDKIKMTVMNGELWYASVSTTDPEKPSSNHTIMIFTKDHTDVDDVISTLDYLEGSVIKSHFVDCIFYKTDKSENARSKSKGREKSWKYCSKTIRSSDLIHDTYEFDIRRQELIADSQLRPTEIKIYPPWLYSQLRPTEIKIYPPWLYAKNNKYTDESIDNEKVGKWILVLPEGSVDAAWDKIKKSIAVGELWFAKVYTRDFFLKDFPIMIFTKDYTDLVDIIHVLDYLESFEIKPPNVIMTYETNKPTNAHSSGSKRSWIYSSFTIRLIGLTSHMIRSTDGIYEFDIHENKLITNCILYPSETSKGDFEWLHAKNNKYINDSVDNEKIGQWVLFLKRRFVDETWDKIKLAVTNGELWSSKVSTTDPERAEDKHTIIVFTKDYTDRDDVICSLDFLESSGIKPRGEIMKYEADQQTMFRSDTIRRCNRYEFDIHENKLISDCNLNPSQTTHHDFVWLRAQNNKYPVESLDAEKVGKWMLFIPRHNVDKTWSKVKTAVASGELWSAIVSTVDPDRPEKNNAILIYTKDYTDVDDVIRVLDYLESSRLKSFNGLIKYKTEQQSGEKILQGGRARAFMYDSDTIRSLRSPPNDTYEFDIDKMELVTDCDVCPTEIVTHPPWLYANNNKYPEESIILKKVGKWTLFLWKDNVDLVWDKVKKAVANGKLWSVKVSTTKLNMAYYLMMVYTVDYTDVSDVIKVLDYLESSGIKSNDVNIKYTEEHTKEVNWGGIWYAADERPWIYSSVSIRSKGLDQPMDRSTNGVYEFDIHERKVVTDCTLHPSATSESDFKWLHARNNKHSNDSIDNEKVGKWMLFLPINSVDAAWYKIKMAITSGDLWSAKVSTTKLNDPYYGIMVYTVDYADINDVVKVLDYLETSRIKPRDVIIKYTEENEHFINRRDALYPRPWLYLWNTVRNYVSWR